MIGAARDDRQFRRGMVLGLTMAEVLLLLIFLLLLLLGVKLKEAITERDEAFERVIEAEREVAALRAIMPDVTPGATKFDITKDYERIKEELEATKKALAESKLGIQLIEKAKAQFRIGDANEAARVLAEDAEIGAAVRASADGNDAQSAASCKSELASCRGQVAYLNSKVNEKTGGFDWPPCWADPTGQPQFIFNAKLRDEGIVLVDNHVAGREEEQRALPLQAIRFEQPLDRASFAAAVAPLLQWSKEHNCRFFVRLYDQMIAGSRIVYKDLRSSVEGYFYIYKMN